MHFLWSVLAQASAISLVATALALFLRSTGVIIMESAVFGTATALAAVTVVSHQSPAAPQGRWFVLSAALALALTVSLLAFYRLCRNARGGDATTLMMSFAIMNVLALLLTKFTDGKSVSVGADLLGSPIYVAIVGWGTILSLHLVSRQVPGGFTALKLARDNDSLLVTFGLSGNKIRITSTLAGCFLLALGSGLFVIGQENFAPSKYELYLIPAFSVAISRKRLEASSIAATSLGLVAIEKFLESLGEPLLMRAYQGGILVVLALCAPTVSEAFHRLRYRRASEA